MTQESVWRYRWRQFARVRAGKLTAEEQGEIAGVLSPPLLRRFLGMRGMAQRHGYDVYRTLKAQGWDDSDLAAAALLHDVGKGRLGVLSRAAWVLLGAWSPDLRERLAPSAAGRWLGLWENHRHAERGAALVARLGASPIVAWLVQHHQLRDHHDPVLTALQIADADN